MSPPRTGRRRWSPYSFRLAQAAPEPPLPGEVDWGSTSRFSAPYGRWLTSSTLMPRRSMGMPGIYQPGYGNHDRLPMRHIADWSLGRAALPGEPGASASSTAAASRLRADNHP